MLRLQFCWQMLLSEIDQTTVIPYCMGSTASRFLNFRKLKNALYHIAYKPDKRRHIAPLKKLLKLPISYRILFKSNQEPDKGLRVQTNTPITIGSSPPWTLMGAQPLLGFRTVPFLVSYQFCANI